MGLDHGSGHSPAPGGVRLARGPRDRCSSNVRHHRTGPRRSLPGTSLARAVPLLVMAAAAPGPGCPPTWEELPELGNLEGKDAGRELGNGDEDAGARPDAGSDGGQGQPCPSPYWTRTPLACVLNFCMSELSCPEGSSCLPGPSGVCSRECVGDSTECGRGAFCIDFGFSANAGSMCIPMGGLPTGAPCTPLTSTAAVLSTDRSQLCRSMSCPPEYEGASRGTCTEPCEPTKFDAQGRALSPDCQPGEFCSFPGDLFIPVCARPGWKSNGWKCTKGFECASGICICAGYPCTEGHCSRSCSDESDCEMPGSICRKPNSSLRGEMFCFPSG